VRHFQGFVIWKKKQRYSYFHNNVGKAACFTAMDKIRARHYCHKPCKNLDGTEKQCKHDFCDEERKHPTAQAGTFFEVGNMEYDKGEKTLLLRDHLKESISSKRNPRLCAQNDDEICKIYASNMRFAD